MINTILIDNKHSFQIINWDTAMFSGYPVLDLITDDMKFVKETFANFKNLKVFRGENLIAEYEIFDGISSIQYKLNCYISELEDNSDVISIQLTKKNIIEQVESIEKEVFKKVDINGMNLEATKEYKKGLINEDCHVDITNGVELELLDGTKETFSLTADDQNNISTLASLLMQNDSIEMLPYHADGKACREYARLDLLNLYMQMNMKITYATTRCNFVKIYMNTLETKEDVLNVSYSETVLPEEYQSQVDAIMESARAIMEGLARQVMPTTISAEDEDGTDITEE